MSIQSEFQCTGLKASKTQVQVDEPFTVAATVAKTFIDGSNIELYVDGKVAASKLVCAREEGGREISFALKLKKPGPREIKVGDRTASVLVKGE